MAAENTSNKPPKKKINPALKYSGMAMQMALTIGVGIWIGGKIDAHFETSKPYFTILLAILALTGVMYSIIRDVSKGD